MRSRAGSGEQPVSPMPGHMASEHEVGTFGHRGLGPVTIDRLVRCYHICAQLQDEGTEVAFSQEIGERIGCSPSLIRKDLSRIGKLGTPGNGYRVAKLKTILGQVLGIGGMTDAILVGAGSLGTALLNYSGFERQGFRFAAVFDVDQKKIGMPCGSLTVKDVCEIPTALRSLDADIGVLAVPATEAQRIAELLRDNGVCAILNLTPAAVSPGESVVVSNVDLAIEMEKLLFRLANARGTGRGGLRVSEGRETLAGRQMMKTETWILVAEDEQDMLRGLEQMLGEEGYHVEAVKDGLEGAEKIKTEHFDVVIADLKMPIIDGMGLLRAAKQKDHSVVFIMITGYGTTENAVEAMKLGSSDYISKPFAPSDLVAAIQKGLRERGQVSSPKSPAALQTSKIYRFPSQHAWASPQPDGTVVIGADERFFEEAGEIVFCDLPLQGDRVVRGQSCARTVNATGLSQKPFHCPMSGTVFAVNRKMEHKPWESERDPYGDGWLFTIIPSNLDEEIGPLRSQEKRATNDGRSTS